MVRKLIAKPASYLLFIIFLGILGYSNTLNAPFVFDDRPNIETNTIVKNIDYYLAPAKARIHTGFAEYPMFINRYVGSLTFALNYKIHGLDVTGYHVVNILIHLINTLLVYWFIQLIFITPAFVAQSNKPLFRKHVSLISLATACLFVTHPIQTQAVTYIVQRFASLATMFYLISFCTFAKFRLTPTKTDAASQTTFISYAYYLTSLLAAVLAMKTKEIAFTLPAMIVFFEFLFFAGKYKNRIPFLIPFLLTMIIIPATRIYLQNLDETWGPATSISGSPLTRFEYLFTSFRVVITYIRLIIFPVNQNLDYDYPIYHSLFAPEVLLSCTTLLLICSAVFYAFRRFRKTQPLTRIIFFGSAWFFVTLSVESSIIPIPDVIFEHRLYLPSFGIFLAISALVAMIIKESRQRWVETTVYCLVIIAMLLLTWLTYSRNHVWKDKVSLWQDVVAKSPGKASGLILLGAAYAELKDYKRATIYFNKAISPERNNAITLAASGQSSNKPALREEADLENKEAMQLQRDLVDIHNNLDLPFDKRIEKSFVNLNETLRQNFDMAAKHINQGIEFDRIGRTTEAITEFRAALRLQPNMAEAHNSLGIALAKIGQTSEAIIEFKEALRLAPEMAAIHNNLGMALGNLDRLNEAINEFKEALRLQPDLIEAQNSLIIALNMLDQKKQATGVGKNGRL